MIEDLTFQTKEYSLCNGITAFGVEYVIKFFNKFYYHYKFIPCISVGSGLGVFEKMCQEKYNEKREKRGEMILYLIEPDPYKFCHDTLKSINKGIVDSFINLPHYKYIEDILRDRKELVNNSLLLLNWCDPKDSIYDFVAIEKAKPIAIISIYEECLNEMVGAAGGHIFQIFLKYIEFERKGLYKENCIFENKNFLQKINISKDEHIRARKLALVYHIIY